MLQRFCLPPPNMTRPLQPVGLYFTEKIDPLISLLNKLILFQADLTYVVLEIAYFLPVPDNRFSER